MSSVSTSKYLLLMGRAFLKILITGAFLFWIAGTVNYIQGWVLLILFLMLTLVNTFLFWNRRELILERTKPGKGAKKWDLVILSFFGLLSLALIVVAVLDAARYGWSPSFSLVVYIIAYVFLGLSVAFAEWAAVVNNYFATVVRIQSERGHKVVTDGPYRHVRHPGYSSIIVSVFALPVVMGSLWALIPSVAILFLFILRTSLEDKTLQNELEGYKEYAQKVRYRLIPGVW